MSDPPLSRSFGAGDIALVRRLVSDHPVVAVLSRTRRQDLVLAVDEIVTNAVRHGGGRGHLELWLAAGKLFFRVSDRGPGIPSETPPVPPAANQLGGRGIWIARQIVDEMTIATSADGTVVTATMTV